MNRIIFAQEDGTAAIVVPAEGPAKAKGLKAIAGQAVPTGVPYWIVDISEIPTDREFRNAWEIDEAELGKPDGYGA